ncbi:2-polyprenylphenol hydroxylase-related flavodoxin oxidoreductase [Archaeoglobus sulfaticallidus PM70-1]|uniref:2-polyprenylphenol hydroxylase-related flavodoxin oxidoreductase n=1 Tax=Archaeoglobus sulfaticallidus PM70-1 TaxID=387631 RepID=N0BMD5_9EURY|nr:FAD/NAD(P)-binding protein [Archaeoglobus sulfaticallidus]AGK61791.1 2-polyprenylphenol hydroxylase-related flavodoxin oxidoreductase [Archaeoglobus sulfaticallidus PM70-1]
MSTEIYNSENPYLPFKATIIDIKDEVKGPRPIKTFRLKVEPRFNYQPGQGCLVSVFGRGESWFTIANSPTRPDIEFSVLKTGKVTTKLHEMDVGDVVGLRGPHGRPFPVEEWKGMNILTVGGGIGQTPLRSVYQYVMDNEKDYGDLTIVYGARTSKDLVYKDELMKMIENGYNVELSIDMPEEGWKYFVGFVPDNLKRLKPNPENTIAVICGPPIMIKISLNVLKELGFKEEQVYTTLERRMKCGIGKCGRCRIEGKYVCKDGPVFRYDELSSLLEKA